MRVLSVDLSIKLLHPFCRTTPLGRWEHKVVKLLVLLSGRVVVPEECCHVIKCNASPDSEGVVVFTGGPVV